MFLKHDFFMFWGILGTFHFSFFGLRGGAKIFGSVAKGGGVRKILDVSRRGAKNFGPPNFFLIQGVNEYALKK